MIKESREEQPKDSIAQVIAQWEREMPALESHEMRLIGLLVNCSNRVIADLEALYAEYNVNQGEFDVLSTLRRSGAPYELSPTEIFSTLMITSGTMTNRLQRLEKKGLVTRKVNPEDARSMLVVLNDEGLKLINLLIVKHVAREKILNRLLDDEGQRLLESKLTDWLHALKEIEDE